MDVVTVLDNCSKDVFSKYGMSWMMRASQVLENSRSDTYDLTLACKVLGFSIERCKEIPELNKQISMHSVKQLVSTLGALRPEAKCGAIYYLLAVLLYHYPEVCEKFQVSIKKMILLQIDSAQENLVHASAKCHILLSRAMERSFKPPAERSVYTRWMYDEALLCNSLHAIMDTLFLELVELESVDVWDQLKLPSISEKDTVQYYNEHKRRFSNLCIYLSCMLRGHQAKNSVLPHDIFKVLCRGLAVTPLNLKNATFKEQMLSTILPELHISLLSVLDALINGFAQELIPFGSKILQLFQQTFQWTGAALHDQSTASDSKLVKDVKRHVYKCLSSWLMNTGSLSGIETTANEYVAYMLKDIIPERDRILLTVQQRTQHSSKRAIKRFKSSQYENSSILNNEAASIRTESLDRDLCKEALVALQNILSSGSVLLKATFYKNVQNSVIPLLHNLYSSCSEQNFYTAHTKCRLELFKVLKALQMNPHVTLAFPMQYALEISHMAARDIDLNIAQEARLALAELEKIIHPAAPTLRLSRKVDASVEADESQADESEVPHVNTHDVVRTPMEQDSEDALRDVEEEEERQQEHCSEGNGSNVDKVVEDIDIEGTVIECEVTERVDAEKDKLEQAQQPEDSASCTNHMDETVPRSSVSVEENYTLQDNAEEQEEMNAEELEFQSLFHDDVILTD